MGHRYLLLAGTVLLAGCSMIPALDKPSLPVMSNYPAYAGVDSENAADLSWKAMFGDARLQELIRIALQNNRDLRVALLNVEAAQAQFVIQRGQRFPNLDANSTYSQQKTAEDLSQGVQGTRVRQHTVDLAMTSFEIDLFGRLRSMSEAAFERYLSTDEGRKSAQIALIGAVADAYLSERLAEEQLHLTERTLIDWKKSLELTQMLKVADQNSGLDITEAESIVYQTEADLEKRRRILMQAGNLLTLLVGSEIPQNLPTPIPLLQQPISTELPAGLPSELLANRPDIKQAEHELIAANADIGAARAAFFPRLSLTAALGFASADLSGLFSSENKTWSYAPQVSLPLFRGGALKGELNLAKLRKSAAVANYEKTIQVAFREVADGLAGRVTYGNQVAAQIRTVNAELKRLQLSDMRYKAGLDSRLQLLDAQRTSYASQQLLLDIKFEEYQNAANLYKALGGGLKGE